MTDRPILFSGPMVRALIREVEAPGTGKRETRRLAWGKPRARKVSDHRYHLNYEQYTPPTVWQKVRPGDRLWVRETCMPSIDAGGADFRYAADYDAAGIARMHDLQNWTPSIHMPRRFSRLTLVVTETRMQRVQEISEADAIAEGSRMPVDDLPPAARGAAWCERQVFSRLWNTLHKPGNRWDDNPEVVALTFTVHLENIDRMEAV